MAFKDWYRRTAISGFAVIEDSKWEPGERVESVGMRVFALKYKDKVIKISTEEYDIDSDYRWEREDIKAHLKIVPGTFTEDVA